MNTSWWAIPRILIGAIIVLGTFGIGLYMFGAWHDEWSGYNASFYVSDGICNIAVIPVHGEISSYTYYDENGIEILTSTLDEFELALRTAEQDPLIAGVMVSVDSGGGSPYAGEAMANGLKRSPLPSAAVIRDMGASSAYWLSTGADTIIASGLSSVGSIGITMSYLEYAQQNEDSGLYFVEIATGPYKDSGNPDKYLSEEERAVFQGEMEVKYQEFIRSVAENRGLTIEQVTLLADGSTLVGSNALAAGLIDQIGDKETARAWFASTLGLDARDVIFCE